MIYHFLCVIFINPLTMCVLSKFSSFLFVSHDFRLPCELNYSESGEVLLLTFVNVKLSVTF